MVTTSQSLLNMHAPLKVKKLRNCSLAHNLVLMTKTDRMKKVATKNPILWPNYEGLHNQCTYAMRKPTGAEGNSGLIEETKDDCKKM